MKYKTYLVEQDGEVQLIATGDKPLELDTIKEVLGCSIAEVIPDRYALDAFLQMGKLTIYGDEEARFKEGNVRNVMMKTFVQTPAQQEQERKQYEAMGITMIMDNVPTDKDGNRVYDIVGAVVIQVEEK